MSQHLLSPLHYSVATGQPLWRITATFLLASVLLVSGCAKRPDGDAAQSADTASSATDATLSARIVQPDNPPSALAGKQLVLTADVQLRVTSVQQAVQQVGQLTSRLGGYVASSQITSQSGGEQRLSIGHGQQKVIEEVTPQARMIVRLPKAQVEAFLQQLQQQAVAVDQLQVDIRDVTLEIEKAQLEASVRAIQSGQDEQGRPLSAVQQATLAAAQRRLGEIAVAELRDQVAFSTLTLQFSQPQTLRTRIEPDVSRTMAQEQNGYFWARLWRSLVDGWQYGLRFVVWLAQGWLILLTLGLMGWALVAGSRWWRRRQIKSSRQDS